MTDSDAVTGREWSLPSLLGLRGGSTGVLLGLLLFTMAMIMMRNVETAAHEVPIAVGFAVMAVAAVVVVRMPSDPLPLPLTIVIAALGPVITLATAGDLGSDRTMWTSFAYSYVLCLLAVRGRMWWAWIGVAAMGLAALSVSHDAGFTADALAGAIAPIGTVAAVSVFAVLMQPTLESLRALQQEALVRAAGEAALAGQSEERDRQLARLDAIARPALERIASGDELDLEMREECRLLEAELRDGLRAPQLSTATLSAAARTARSRGVEVALLDDGGLSAVSENVSSTVLRQVAEALDSARIGSITVRILPKGRRIVATLLINESGHDRRTEIDHDGVAQTSIDPAENF